MRKISNESSASNIFRNFFLTLDTGQCCNCKERAARLFCENCSYKGFCQEFYTTVHDLPMLSDHRASESKPSTKFICSDHPLKELEFCCAESKPSMCSNCLVSKQPQHKFILITDAVHEISQQVNCPDRLVRILEKSQLRLLKEALNSYCG